MPNIYVMSENKTFKNPQKSNNYVGENNAECIFILLPEFYNGHDIKKCIISMEFESNSRALNANQDLYNGYLVYQIQLDMSFTKSVGKKEFYITIKDVNYNVKTEKFFIEIIER